MLINAVYKPSSTDLSEAPRDMKLEVTDQNIEILENFFFTLFGEISDEQKEKIIIMLDLVTLKRGEYLFHQNDEADGLYAVLSGKLEAIVTDNEDNEHTVGYITRSETVGEMALISGDKRSASIRCFRNSLLAKLTNEQFLELCNMNPQFALNISKIIVKRLRSSIKRKKRRDTYTTMVLFDADEDQGNDVSISALIKSYQAKESIGIINQASINAHIPGFSIESHYLRTQLDHYISDCELEHDRVIFDTRDMDTSLVNFIADYSDIFLIFKNAETGPELTNIEEELYKYQSAINSKIRLIICHPLQTDAPIDTEQYLALRPEMLHLNILQEDRDDIERVRRCLTNSAYSLVLGGGGAKGLAHLGVLKALKESNIPIDFISGTSMGSIIAAFYALSRDLDKLFDYSQRFFVKNKPTKTSDLNIFPFKSFYKDRRINAQLHSVFGKRTIEDLWLPFFCVSSNISAPCMKIHERGGLAKALRASMSVPGLFPPVVIDNELHVDGALFNNVPIDIAMNKNVGTIMACRVDREEKNDSEQIKIPSLLNTFVKSTVAYSDSHSLKLQGFVDVFFEPEVSHFGLLSWKSHDDIVNAGYRHAMKILEEHPDLIS